MTRMNWEGVSLKTDSRCIHLDFLFLCTGFESWVTISLNHFVILTSYETQRTRQTIILVMIVTMPEWWIEFWHRQNDNYSDVSNKTKQTGKYKQTNKNTNRIAMMGLAMIKTLWETLWCISARPDREMSRPPLPTKEKLTNKKIRFFFSIPFLSRETKLVIKNVTSF